MAKKPDHVIVVNTKMKIGDTLKAKNMIFRVIAVKRVKDGWRIGIKYTDLPVREVVEPRSLSSLDS